MALGEIVKDPAATIDCAIDWSHYLGADTISEATWTVPEALTSVAETTTATRTTIRISGGELHQRYENACTVTLNSGQVDVRRLVIVIQEM